MDEVIGRSALEQAALVRQRELSVEELTRVYLGRIERLEPSLSAFTQLAPGRALAAARALDQGRRRQPRGPLWGVPTAMKDLHLTRGFFLRLGSRAFRYFWSPIDDETSAAVRSAGMVIVGKLATSELAILPFVDTALQPPTRNPWDRSRYSGGSSGGSAAAIAAGMLPIAVASDGGGSTRIPAAFCGLVGHKPTRGSVPNPFAPFERLSLSAIGPHARGVDDAAALLDVLRGDLRDEGELLQAARRTPPPLRVRFSAENPLLRAEPPVVRAVERVAKALADLGHSVDEGPFIEGSVDDFLPMFFHLTHTMFVPFPSLLEPTSLWLRERGRSVSFEQALELRELFRRRVDERFEGVDLWVTPTVGVAPPPVGTWKDASPEGRMRGAAMLGVFTAALNASGHPATSVPLWPEPGGLPVGVQLIAPRGHDARLLAVARALLEALGTPLTPLAPA